MDELWSLLKQILLGIQLLAALTGCFYFFKLKNSYWKWFAVYLVIIFIQEYLLTIVLSLSVNTNQFYNLLIGLPLEFIFLYWLYAKKSLRKHKLFVACSIIYLATCILAGGFLDVNVAIGLCFSIGSLILAVFVVFEYLKQIKNDSILKFKENRMFYINFGVILFYFGSLPLHIFQGYLYPDYKVFVEFYFVYFLIANCMMYLLFMVSLVWGKEQS